jgi:hypothetical protein
VFDVKRQVIGVAALALLAGCETIVTSPSVSFDPTPIDSSSAAITATFENSALFQSMVTLASAFPAYKGTFTLRLGLPSPRTSPSALASRAAALRRETARFSSGVQALFPTNVLGHTLAWDTATSKYVLDTTLAGAPAAGIRILIYVPDTLAGVPAKPLQPIGALDLTDKSAGSAEVLGVLLAVGNVAIAAYDITVVPGQTSGTVAADGYIQNPNGTGRVDFAFHDAISNSAVDVECDLVSGVTEVKAGIVLTATSGALAVSVTKGLNTVSLAVTDGATLTGQVKYNGTAVATVGGTAQAPVFTGIGGRQMGSAEVAALVDIFARALNVVNGLGNIIFAPGNTVF